MHYYLYKEDQIQGPYTFSDIEEAGFFSDEILLCEESEGMPSGNWQPIGNFFPHRISSSSSIDQLEDFSEWTDESKIGNSEELSWVTPFLNAKRNREFNFPLIDRYLPHKIRPSLPSQIRIVYQPELPPASPSEQTQHQQMRRDVIEKEIYFKEKIWEQIQNLQRRFDELYLIQKKEAPVIHSRPLPPTSIQTPEIQNESPAIEIPHETNEPHYSPLQEKSSVITPPIFSDTFTTHLKETSSIIEPPLESALPLKLKDNSDLINRPNSTEEAPVEKINSPQETEGIHLKMGDSFTVISDSPEDVISAAGEEAGGLRLKMSNSFESLSEQEENPIASEEIKSQAEVAPEEFSFESPLGEIQTTPDPKEAPEVQPSHFFEQLSQPHETAPSESPVAKTESPHVEESIFQSEEKPTSSVMEPIITPLFETPLQPLDPPQNFSPSFPAAHSEPVISPAEVEKNSTIPFQPAAGSQDLIERLSKQPEETLTAQKQKPQKKPRLKIAPLIGIGMIVLVVGFFFLFFRNPKDLGNMLSAGADQKPIGMDVKPTQNTNPNLSANNGATAIQAPLNSDLNSAPIAPQDQVQSAPPPTTPATNTPENSQPQEVASPVPQAPQTPVIKKPSKGEQKAIEFVKEYPVEGAGGSVASALNSAFKALDTSNAKQEWTSGKLDQNTYLVRYRVIQDHPSKKSRDVVYLFEADVKGGMIKGDNPLARALLSGEAPKKARKKKKYHRPDASPI